MNRKEKEIFVTQLIEELRGRKNFIFTSYQGVKTGEITQLRNKLRSLLWECRVVKNSLYQRVFKNLDLNLEEFFQGPTALLLEKHIKGTPSSSQKSGENNLIEVSKVLVSFIQGYPKFRINGGLIYGRHLSAEEIANLAKLPSKDVLLRQVVGGMKFPLIRLSYALKVSLLRLIYILNGEVKKKQNK